MNIYISCPYSFSDGLDTVFKYLSFHVVGSIACNKRGETYDFSLLEQADCVVFVLDNLKWQEKLENISRGMLSELIYCLNHKKSFYLAYRSADGINIYGARITDDLLLSGIAGTKGNIFKLQETEPVFQIRGSITANDGIGWKLSANDTNGIDYELEETPKSTKNYFY